MENLKTICDKIIENNKRLHELNERTWNANYSEKKNIYKEIDRLDSVNKVLKNNAVYVLFKEKFPIMLKIMEKYKNKPMGEKTKEKLQAEVKEATGCNIWIKCRAICIHVLNEEGNYNCIVPEVNAFTDTHDKSILKNNRLQVYALEEYVVNAKEYIEDIDGYLRKISDLKEKAKAIQAELETVCSKYNSLAVGGVEYLNFSKRIY